MRRRAFVDHELLPVIVVTLIWMGLSLPLWGRLARELGARGVRVGFWGHLGLAVVAFAIPALFVGLLLGLERLWDRFRRPPGD